MIRFPEGMIGFSDFKNYVLLQKKQDKPFKWPHSADDSNLAFLLIDPLIFFPHYKIKPDPDESAELKQLNLEKLKIYVMVTLCPDPLRASANLIAPLIFNFEKNLGKQIVLPKSPYTTRHNLLGQ